MSLKDNSITTVFSRWLVLALALAVLSTALVPVTAQAAEESDWIELLEYSTVNGQPHNTFTINGTSGSFSMPLQMYTMVARVDILIWHQSAETITSAKCGSQTLSVTRVDAYVSRVYGLVPTGYYKQLPITLTKSTSRAQTWEVLSFRYTSISTLDMPADADIWVDGDQSNVIAAPGDYVTDGGGTDFTLPIQVPVIVNDWRKFNSITIHGAISGVGLNSVRASLGTLGLPYEMTYTNSIPTGTAQTYRESVTINHYDTTNSSYGTISGTYDSHEMYLGKTLFTITIDLSGVDRTNNNTLTVWFTGVTYDGYSHAFSIQGVTGSIDIANKATTSWWNRFTLFMETLFNGATPEADEFEEEMENMGQDFDDAHDQMNSIAKPDVDNIVMDPSSFLDPAGTSQATSIFSAIFGNSLVMTLITIALICSLAAFIIF